MKKTFKYRIKANKKTIQRAENWLELCRKLYNNSLKKRIEAYKEKNKSISCYAQMKKLPSLKKEFPEYKKVNSQTLQDVIQRLDRAYQNFFRRVKNGKKPGFPRFKSKNRYDSFTLKQTGYKLEDKYFFIKNIGRFKIFLSRPIEGDIKTTTIYKAFSGKWYASFSCDNVPWNSFRALNRSMRDVAWFNFFNILIFKAEEAGKKVIKVPSKNTSQMCSGCGKIVPKTLADRIHKCPFCGLVIDRDVNAARNILRLGQSLQGAEALVSAMN